MEFIERDAPKNYNVFLIGDVHIGTLLHYNSGFKNALEMLNRPYKGFNHNIMVGMGDYIEAIDVSDKRFDTDTIDKNMIRPDNQREYFESLIKPYRKKIATLLYGNHEDTLMRYHDYVRSVCRSLSIPYGTYTCVPTFPTWKLYATHGRGTIRTVADDPIRQESNLLLSLKRKLKNKAADCAVMAMGHIHKLLISDPKKNLYMTSNGKDLIQSYTTSRQNDSYIHPDHRWYVATGSFLKTYRRGVSGYAEKAMYDPSVLGFPVVVVRNGLIQGIDPIYL